VHGDTLVVLTVYEEAYGFTRFTDTGASWLGRLVGYVIPFSCAIDATFSLCVLFLFPRDVIRGHHGVRR
jgi:uncharacterized membrane protein YjfL (UPF0719 family)